MSKQTPAIEAKGLNIEYKTGRGKKKLAVENLSFHVEQGEIVGFIGPNGAGKTSTIKALLEIQKAGKGLYIGASPEQAKIYHRTLRPEKVMYDVWVSSHKEAEDLLKWLKENT